MWAAQPDPFAVEVESLVQRALQQEGITEAEIVAGRAWLVANSILPRANSIYLT
jgi:hypothetical protein